MKYDYKHGTGNITWNSYHTWGHHYHTNTVHEARVSFYDTLNQIIDEEEKDMK